MCGIVCLITKPPVVPQLVKAMNNSVRHRGPDDEGYVFFGGEGPSCLGGGDTPQEVFSSNTPYSPRADVCSMYVPDCHLAFGHRRLSIQDLSPLGHQPMCYLNRYWIIYNGEVYNFVELRRELEAKGYKFISHSDTEVILAAYDHWGAECLNHFNGMWAFVLYDAVYGRIFASRDRFGVKPLYYFVSPSGGIAFASEIKQFTVLPDWQARINGQRVYDFLNWALLDHTDETLFQGVFQVPSGGSVEIDISDVLYGDIYQPYKRLPSTTWWDLSPRDFQGSLETAALEFKEALHNSVRLRLRSDVPVGSCLSGGLDSSSIVCVMNEILHDQEAIGMQKTFSACSEIARFDERLYIDEILNVTNVKPHYVFPAPHLFFDSLEEIVWHQDEPICSASVFAQWLVFQSASENSVRVMLDGQGADELLAGYSTFIGPYLAGLWKRGNLSQLWSEAKGFAGNHEYSICYLGQLVVNMLISDKLRAIYRKLTDTRPHSPSWLDVTKLGAIGKDPFIGSGYYTDSIQRMSYAQTRKCNLPMLLHWEDRNSMAHSVESRIPFLDFQLAEFLFGLPDQYKLNQGTSKIVLREGTRGLLPDKIRLRCDKMGFVTPEEVWVRETCPELFIEYLRDAIDASRGILKPEALTMAKSMIDGKKPFDHTIVRLISFGIWLKKFEIIVE